jgi:hypothetical protein
LFHTPPVGFQQELNSSRVDSQQEMCSSAQFVASRQRYDLLSKAIERFDLTAKAFSRHAVKVTAKDISAFK